jgi:hypothetical protein
MRVVASESCPIPSLITESGTFLLFGIFSRCDSMGEVCDGMRALGGKLNYLGMESSPAKSTAGDALRDRDEELFRLFYFALIAHFSPLLSVSI